MRAERAINRNGASASSPGALGSGRSPEEAL
jgi:hypothetical protein